MARPITFLSDYGSSDEFAGVCRAVIARIAPEARGDRPQPRDRAATTSARAPPCSPNALGYAPAGVHLAVVDPGVGTGRRAVAVAAAEEERLFVGPDNGLLSLALERFGGAAEAVEISSSPARLEPVSATFHGRDLFAPGRRAPGARASRSPSSASRSIRRRSSGSSPAGPRSSRACGSRPRSGTSTRSATSSLIATAADADDAGLEPGKRLRVRGPRRSDEAVYALTFADAEPGEMVLLVDSARSLALAVNRGDAAAPARPRARRPRRCSTAAA